MADSQDVTRDYQRETYEAAYKDPKYRLKGIRLERTRTLLAELLAEHHMKSYLDVGCGRGEVLELMTAAGLQVAGLEVVPTLCRDSRITEGVVTDLPWPDRSFDVVSAFDVLEHLPENEVPVALREMWRVAQRVVIVSVSWKKAKHYHLTLQPARWWLRRMGKIAEPKVLLLDEKRQDLFAELWKP